MRRLSDRLGVALGATYHHVADRDTLLQLVAERINSEIVLLSTRPDRWASTVRTLLIDYARAYGRHPGMASVVNNHLGSMPPDATQRRLLQLLTEAGFTDEHARTVLATLFFYTSGATANELMFRDHPSASAAQLNQRFEQGLDVVIEGARSLLRADRRERRASDGH
jgi:AcrR family transcriptional regulator